MIQTQEDTLITIIKVNLAKLLPVNSTKTAAEFRGHITGWIRLF